MKKSGRPRTSFKIENAKNLEGYKVGHRVEIGPRDQRDAGRQVSEERDMRMRRVNTIRRGGLALAMGGALVLAGCQAAPQPAFNPDDPAIASAIDAQLKTILDGSATVDADKVLASAGGPGEFSFIRGDVMLSGLDDIRARFKDTYAGLTKQDQTVFERRVRVLSPDVAVVLLTGEGTYTDKAGWTSEPVGLGVTLVFMREGDAWRVRHAHQSIGN